MQLFLWEALHRDGVVVMAVIDFFAAEFLEADTPQELAKVLYATNSSILGGNSLGATSAFTFTNGIGQSGVTNSVTIGGLNHSPDLATGSIHFQPQSP